MRMEEKLRSSDQSEILVKKRSSSGCLIVRKNGDAVSASTSSGYRKVYDAKNEKKRARLVKTDSESSEDLPPLPPPRRAVPRKRSMSDVFNSDEYDDGGTLDAGGRFSGPSSFLPSGSRTAPWNRKNFGNVDWYDMKRSGNNKAPLVLPQEWYMKSMDEPIRVQGKNGVLKVHVNKKKKAGGSSRDYGQWKREERRNFSWSEPEEDITLNSKDAAAAGMGRSEKPSSLLRMNKVQKNLHNSMPAMMITNSLDQDSEDSDALPRHSRKNHKTSRSEDFTKKSFAVLQSREEKKRSEKLENKVENKLHSQKSVSTTKISDLKQRSKNSEARDSVRTVGEDYEKNVASVKSIKRGIGTEKQKLRENIKNMLLNAGWKIDYRPRRNRDYLDAVYINPAGTGYWSIVKAYEALQKQLLDSGNEEKPSEDHSAFKLPDETLSQLTRKTQKKMEKEMKKKQKEALDREKAAIASRKKACYSEDEEAKESMGSDSQEENPSSLLKQGVKSFKVNNADDSLSAVSDKNLVRYPAYSNFSLEGRKSRKLGTCTLLVRTSDNSNGDGFVVYTGVRSLLSWLIDSGVVQLSQKVQYMNRRGTKVLLEGWITRDGIHCGCCSKILTVQKFEIHAGSKLHQPFQNIYLDSGVSLLECQIDAWNRLEEFKQLGFCSVNSDGDGPNDDTCGICGDGGDLICCDGCPSTFHQSCLNIKMLPTGNWHCPTCACKFCGLASGCASHDYAASVSGRLTCNLCQRKFHKSCTREMAAPAPDSTISHCFCSQKCRELFEHLQNDLGVKHELEGGFSWCFIRRTDPNSDPSSPRFPQRVECNCKLAVAFSIMEECFLPIVDRRTGINVIHNVHYNCGSNFNRINYGGFYTVILERGDEIISAASLRFHGSRLAEMPFIGTRHIYRRQGMCRRLLSAIESALRSLNVERLVIPELMQTWWTGVFGFTSLAGSLKELLRSSLNIVVFPGFGMLHKLLFEQESTTTTTTAAVISERAAADLAIVEIEKTEKVDVASPPPGSNKPERAEFDLSLEQSNNAAAIAAAACDAQVDGGMVLEDDDILHVSSSSTSPAQYSI